jgi:hypothetical protein
LDVFVAHHRNSVICIPNKPQDLEDGFTLHLVAPRVAEGQPSSGTSEGNTHANGKSDLTCGCFDNYAFDPEEPSTPIWICSMCLPDVLLCIAVIQNIIDFEIFD